MLIVTTKNGRDWNYRVGDRIPWKVASSAESVLATRDDVRRLGSYRVAVTPSRTAMRWEGPAAKRVLMALDSKPKVW